MAQLVEAGSLIAALAERQAQNKEEQLMFENMQNRPVTTGGCIPVVVDPHPTFWFEGKKHRDWNGSGQSGTGQNGAGSGWNGSGQNGHGWGGGLRK